MRRRFSNVGLMIAGACCLEAGEAPATLPSKIVISKETTYITEPLRADGMPDYVAAYNAGLPNGKPEENALYWVAKAEGIEAMNADRDVQKSLEQFLGLSDAEISGTKLKHLIMYLGETLGADESKLSEIMYWYGNPDAMTKAPLTHDQVHQIEGYLDASRLPLEYLHKAAFQPYMASPLLGGNVPLDSATQVPRFDWSQIAHDLLMLDAERQYVSGNRDRAIDRLIEIIRISRLQEREGNRFSAITGSYHESIALRAYRAFLRDHEIKDSDYASDMQKFLAIPAEPTVAESIEPCERFDALSTYSLIGSGNAVDAVRSFMLSMNDAATTVNIGDIASVDVNRMMKMENVFQDRVEKLLSSNQLREVVNGLRTLDQEADRARPTFERWDISDTNDDDRKRLIAAEAYVHRKPNETVNAYTDRMWSFLHPEEGGKSGTYLIVDRRLEWDLTMVSIAIARFHLARGQYPATLKELVPAFLKGLPDDPYSTTSFVYRRTEAGYQLYSVGRNGKDDGGDSDLHSKMDDGDASFVRK